MVVVVVVVGTCAIGDRRGGINGRAARGRRARERKKKKRMEKQNQSLPPPWSSPYTADSTPYRNRARDSLTQIARVPCTTVHNHIGRRRHWGGFSLFLALPSLSRSHSLSLAALRLTHVSTRSACPRRSPRQRRTVRESQNTFFLYSSIYFRLFSQALFDDGFISLFSRSESRITRNDEIRFSCVHTPTEYRLFFDTSRC